MGTNPNTPVGARTTETEAPDLEKRQSHDHPSRLECHARSLKQQTEECASNDILVSPDTAQVPSDEKHATDPAKTEYPGGFKLVSIILALVMGIFLASLDMVSNGNSEN
jgi:hypothetical protein